jgi:hypothetical protein
MDHCSQMYEIWSSQSMLIFWVVTRVDLQVDTNISEKQIVSIFRWR